MAGRVRWLDRYQVQNIKRIIKARVVYDLEKNLEHFIIMNCEQQRGFSIN
jgi:hypothetical protein